MNELKIHHGRLSNRRGAGVARAIGEARALRARLDEQMAQDKPSAVNAELLGEISRFSISTVCDKRELFWPSRFFNFRVKEITRILGHYLAPRHGASARADELP